MAKIADWDDHIGRRLRLRDLRVFFAVVQSGSLAKAATQLRVSQPAVSQVIADLEHTLGVKLFDRSSRGVEPTVYARALLTRGRSRLSRGAPRGRRPRPRSASRPSRP